MEDLKTRIQQVNELERQLEIAAQHTRNDEQIEQNEEIEQIAQSLMEENNQLKEQLMYHQETYNKMVHKYKKENDGLKRELIEVTKYHENPDKKLSMKRAADFIRLENEIRQKNLYIDSLLDKIREMQSMARDPSNRSNQPVRLSSRNDTKNSIENSRISNNR